MCSYCRSSLDPSIKRASKPTSGLKSGKKGIHFLIVLMSLRAFQTLATGALSVRVITRGSGRVVCIIIPFYFVLQFYFVLLRGPLRAHRGSHSIPSTPGKATFLFP